MPASFYESWWTDIRLINQQLSKGKLLVGRLFFDPQISPKNYGFVVPDPIVSEDGESSLQLPPIKIWGIRNLNRCWHLDRVYVKLVNWVEWGKSSNKLIKNIDFEAANKYIEYVE